MDASENLEDAFRRACARERELWKQIVGKYPGCEGYSECAWREWLKAAERVRALAAERIRVIRPAR
jgi:hypothetical protein